MRVVARITLAAGAAGSLVFMFMVGRHQRSIILMLLFTGWVLAPFAALLWAEARSKSWPPVAGTGLHIVMLLIALGSLAAYGVVALGPPIPKPAAAFLIVPAASWLPVAVVLAMAAQGKAGVLKP